MGNGARFLRSKLLAIEAFIYNIFFFHCEEFCFTEFIFYIFSPHPLKARVKTRFSIIFSYLFKQIKFLIQGQRLIFDNKIALKLAKKIENGIDLGRNLLVLILKLCIGSLLF